MAQDVHDVHDWPIACASHKRPGQSPEQHHSTSPSSSWGPESTVGTHACLPLTPNLVLSEASIDSLTAQGAGLVLATHHLIPNVQA